MNRAILEKTLRNYPPLKGIEVIYESDFREYVAPHLVTVRGIVSIKGELMAYEVEVDLLKLNTREALDAFVKNLMLSFEEAEKSQRSLN